MLVCVLLNLYSAFPNASYSSIKVGKMSQNPSQIVENINTAIPAIAKAIPGGWDNIQSLHIKTNSSVSLPIWSCVLEDTETGGWHGIGQEGSVTREEEEDREDAAKAKNSKKSKSKKRSPVSEDEAEEAPRKKAKSIDPAGKSKGKPKAGNYTASAPKSLKSSNAMKPEDSISAKQDQKRSDSSKSPFAKSTAPQAAVDGRTKEKEASSLKDTATPSATLKVAKLTSTKEETKAKYTPASFEKKKRLITKVKGGKSVKDTFLGRKVAQG